MCSDRKCIPTAWLCDGEKDCSDGLDEANCPNKCRPDQFQCRNLSCISGRLECNGNVDCLDRSDEDHCNMTASLRSPRPDWVRLYRDVRKRLRSAISHRSLPSTGFLVWRVFRKHFEELDFVYPVYKTLS
ncbi:hypothetical protein HPB47_001959 [Ixodes persulcatus]|uniref:Uncharacterized protein n=1 Tax=Ixodes persulcatus TaxID=34615 RepID=A0AC60PP35_IXOPE|nr:hypothetical protein HPB47_001959 [Ixodes persulcatus]